ncbi:MAG: 16S rRNA (guanine(966)-N(2))-methyltransferase RsmD [Nitrospirae bacterium]|nr:16S rRNA (guanine(966)-N(2))-methyltransferase RsmD [Nitrospirota bacterium]
MVRVISGVAKGRRLKVAKGLRIRPTSDKVKESLFNILAPDLEGMVFLDLFAGCGGVGIEALSRGVAKAIFVEKEPHHLKILEENLEKCGFRKTAFLIREDVLNLLRRKSTPACDIAFVDPPYDFAQDQDLLILLANNVTIRKFIIYEHSRKKELMPRIGPFVHRRTYAYGDTRLSFFEKEKEDS